MQLARFRHILAVARTGSFSRAAEEERITQPALSRSIAAFERHHGVQLFDRGRGGIRPTPAGTLVIEKARQMIAASEELARSLRDYGSGEAGRVAFGIGPLVSSIVLPELGRRMLRARPRLQLVCVTRTPDQLLPELFQDRIEMIVGNNLQIGQVPGTEARLLGKLRLGVTVRAGHPLTSVGSVRVADLIDYPTASAVEISPVGFGGGAGSFVCENFHILRETVLRTNCVWLSSAAFIASDLDSGTLVDLPIVDLAPVETDLCLLVRAGRACSPAAMAVAQEIERILSDNVTEQGKRERAVSR